jgi:hypothetical protein
LSLDQEVDTPQGAVNAGKEIVETVLGAAGEGADGDQAVKWTEYASQGELDAALEDQDVYAAIVVPQDFTSSRVDARAQVARAQGEVLAEQLPALMADPAALAQGPEALSGIVQGLAQIEPAAGAPLRIVVNVGKNPMASTAIESMLKEMVGQQTTEYQVDRFNPVTIGGGALNMAQPFALIPTFLLSLVCSVALYLVTRLPAGAGKKAGWRNAAVRGAYALVLSGLVGFAVTGVLAACGLEIAVGATGAFLWLASLALMLLFVGCFAIAPPLGALAVLACFGCGLAAGNLPFEFLPRLYQDWFYPWVPQRFIGEGLRDIFYQDGGPFNSSAVGLAVVGLIGLAALAGAPLIAGRRQGEKTPTA